MIASFTKAQAARSSAGSGAGDEGTAAYRPIHAAGALLMRSGLDHRTRTGLLVGGLSMFFALDIAFLVSLAGFAFAPEALGQAFIEVLPGFIAVPLIGLLPVWAQPLLVGRLLARLLVAGGAVGVLAAVPAR